MPLSLPFLVMETLHRIPRISQAAILDLLTQLRSPPSTHVAPIDQACALRYKPGWPCTNVHIWLCDGNGVGGSGGDD